MTDWIKENWAVVVIVVGMFVGYAELRLPSMVSAEMAKQGLASDSAVSDLKDDLDEQKEVHKDDRDRMDSKIERIVDILLEDS